MNSVKKMASLGMALIAIAAIIAMAMIVIFAPKGLETTIILIVLGSIAFATMGSQIGTFYSSDENSWKKDKS